MKKDKYYTIPVIKTRNGILSKRWYIEWWLYDPVTGDKKRNQEWISTKIKTKTARIEYANRFIAALKPKLKAYQAEMMTKPQTKSGYISLTDGLERVWQIKQTQIRLKTWYSYHSHYTIFIQWLEQHKLHRLPVNGFTVDMAYWFMDWVMTGRKIGNKTYNDYKWFLSGLWKMLVKRNYCEVNPFTRVESLKVVRQRKSILTEQQYKYYINYLRKHDFGMYIICTLIRTTLARPYELIRLKVGHVDLEAHTLIIPQELSKTKQERKPVLPDHVMQILIYLHGYKPGQWLFGGDMLPGIKPISRTGFWKRHDNLLADMGLSETRFTPYKNKHYGAYRMMKLGLPALYVKDQAGHSDLATTEIYLDSIAMNRLMVDAIRKADI
jgi:integrase